MRVDAAYRRVLIYTHNAIGLGHAVRTMAVVDGLRAAWPAADFVVLSGSSVPQMFLSRGVEVVKLPGIRHALEEPGAPYRPRLLHTMDRPALMAWRRHLILDCLDGFGPDLVMVEHCLAGLMGEALPILARKHAADAFTLAHVSRGIYRESPCLLVPDADYDGLPPGTRLARLYDRFFVLEDRDVVDVNQEFFGADSAIEDRIRYLGRIAALNPGEPDGGHAALASLGLAGRRYVLVSLGRHGRIVDLHRRVLGALGGVAREPGDETVVVPDPYLPPDVLAGVREITSAAEARLLPLVPGLAGIVAAARLVVCRAGYNTINDILVAGARALVIPERHPSGEQERRAAGLPGGNLLVRDEDLVLSGDVESWLTDLLGRQPTSPRVDFDRFRIGRAIAEDLAGVAQASRPASRV